MPTAVLTNADLSTFLDTNDEWMVTRTGMKERPSLFQRDGGCGRCGATSARSSSRVLYCSDLESW